MLFPSEHLRAKLLSLTGINESKVIIFVLYYLTVSIYTKTTIYLSVGGQREAAR